MAKIITIQAALQHYADHPRFETDDWTQVPVWQLVAASLYDIANHPDASVRGSFTRANKARALILNRLVGKRRAGSHPATRGNVEVEFFDLTGGEINEAPTAEAE